MTSSLDRLLGQVAQPGAGAREVGIRPAQVVRSDVTGVWVAPIGTSSASPLGPCRAGTYLAEQSYSLPGGTFYRRVARQLPVGAAVLVANTDAGPWIVRHDMPT